MRAFINAWLCRGSKACQPNIYAIPGIRKLTDRIQPWFVGCSRKKVTAEKLRDKSFKVSSLKYYKIYLLGVRWTDIGPTDTRKTDTRPDGYYAGRILRRTDIRHALDMHQSICKLQLEI